MNITTTTIPEVLLLDPVVHRDERGYFMETFRSSYFKDGERTFNFVQDNQSRSKLGTLRGLHYQLKFPQGKLVRVLSGEVFDVAVDLRKSSPTFGHWVGEILSSANKRQLWLPPGFAHGFLVLSETAELFYKCTDYYHPEDDYCLLWSDTEIGIEWPKLSIGPTISQRDLAGEKLTEAPTYL